VDDHECYNIPKLKKKHWQESCDLFGRFLVTFSPEKSDLDLCKKINDIEENSPIFLL
jgi:hypothetical protein